MSMKVAFERFLSTFNIELSKDFVETAPPDFGALFFEFARRNGYDIINNADRTIAAAGLVADEVIDIGVHDGTPWLYKHFQGQDFTLVEPQKRGLDLTKNLPNSYKFLNVAVGAEPGTLILKEDEERTSILERTDVDVNHSDQYQVQVLTLDQIITDNCTSNSIGVKIDTEGFEYNVLKGFKEHYDRVSFMILEVGIRQRYADEKTFSEIVALLLQKGFYFYNIMNTSRPSPPNAYDVLFLPAGHPNFVA